MGKHDWEEKKERKLECKNSKKQTNKKLSMFVPNFGIPNFIKCILKIQININPLIVHDFSILLYPIDNHMNK